MPPPLPLTQLNDSDDAGRRQKPRARGLLRSCSIACPKPGAVAGAKSGPSTPTQSQGPHHAPGPETPEHIPPRSCCLPSTPKPQRRPQCRRGTEQPQRPHQQKPPRSPAVTTGEGARRPPRAIQGARPQGCPLSAPSPSHAAPGAARDDPAASARWAQRVAPLHSVPIARALRCPLARRPGPTKLPKTPDPAPRAEPLTRTRALAARRGIGAGSVRDQRFTNSHRILVF